MIQLVDVNGSTAAYYEYDPYGNAIKASGSHANINPLRYRGYVYDTESGLYYLQSRYYDPKIGRFINADALISTGQGILGNNMFAYSKNSPVTLKDSEGESATVAGGIVGGIFGFVSAVISEVSDDEEDEKEGVRWDKVWDCTVSSAIAGAAAGFVADVVLPSVTCFWLTEWDKIPSSIYHYLPWEYIANRYGGIPGYNSGKYDMIANTYWDNVRILSFVS